MLVRNTVIIISYLLLGLDNFTLGAGERNSCGIIAFLMQGTNILIITVFFQAIPTLDVKMRY